MNRWLVVVVAALLVACSSPGTHKVGETCKSGRDCSKGLVCFADPFPAGYCTADCGAHTCPTGSTCTLAVGVELCLQDCAAVTDCRAGYQCFHDVCQLPCQGDAECGAGFICTAGACGPKPGTPLGGTCMVDSDCSSQLCVLDKCAQGCNRDAICGDTQTCSLDPVGNNAAIPTTHIVPICIARRGSAAPGAACQMDADCDRGTCQLGMCVELCSATGDCHGSNMSCADLVAVLDDFSTPMFRGCLPSHKMLTFPGMPPRFVIPSIAQSFTIYTEVRPFQFDNIVGVISLTDPAGTEIYTVPQTTPEFYNLAIRYEPSESTGTMLVPNAPNRLTLMTGQYRFSTQSSTAGVPVATVYLKLNDPPSTSGTLPLNFYVTDLSGACMSLTLANLQNGAINSATNQMARVFAQAGVTFSSITWHAAPAGTPNTIRVTTNPSPTVMMLPDLDDLLAQATGAGNTSVGLDVVLVRSITDENMGQSGVLGIAGGVPSSPILGTPHSGVAVSLDTLCFLGQSTFGDTVSHELGHSLGLFHNQEMTGEKDPLSDSAGQGRQNLMYWLEDSGSSISAQQGQVIRNDPKVQP